MAAPADVHQFGPEREALPDSSDRLRGLLPEQLRGENAAVDDEFDVAHTRSPPFLAVLAARLDRTVTCVSGALVGGAATGTTGPGSGYTPVAVSPTQYGLPAVRPCRNV